MEFRRDDRGVTVQIGAILLFGFLVVALATYQATVVPAENAEVEYKHNLEVQTDMLNLRGGLLEAGQTGRSTATTVRLGTTYPTRALFVNPPPPSGTIQTVGTNNKAVNVTISDANASDPDARAYLNGSDKRFETGAVVYYPGYTQYRSAPRTGIDTGTGVVYNSQGNATVPLTSQSLVDGNRINLMLVTGNLSRSGSLGTALDTRAVSSSKNTVQVKGPINITFATRLNPERWNGSDGLLGNEDNVSAVTGHSLDGEWSSVTIELKNGSYWLSISKVALGTVGSESEPEPAYIASEEDEVVVNENTTRKIRFELRDRFNNPTGGATVNVSLAAGNPGKLRYDGTTNRFVRVSGSDHNGEIVVKYVVGDINGSSTKSATVTASFNGTGNADAQNATTDVTVVNTDGSGTGGGSSDPGPPGYLAYNDANNNGKYDQNEQSYQKSQIEDGFDNTSVNLVVPSDVGTLALNGNEIKAKSITLETGIDNGNNDVKLTAQSDINIAGQTLKGKQAQIKAGQNGPGTVNANGATIRTKDDDIEFSSNGDMKFEGATLDAGTGSITAELNTESAKLFVEGAVILDSDDELNYQPKKVKTQGKPDQGQAKHN